MIFRPFPLFLLACGLAACGPARTKVLVSNAEPTGQDSRQPASTPGSNSENASGEDSGSNGDAQDGSPGTPADPGTDDQTGTPSDPDGEPDTGPTGKVQRPSHNTGKGFFVLNGKLYDAKGNEFRIRGLNKLHWDSKSPGIPKTGANTERWVVDFRQSTATNLGLMGETIANKIVPMPSSWVGTCKSERSYLTQIVDTWVAQASAWKTIDDQMILNIANEWGPSNSTEWRDAYKDAIRRLREAGYLATIAVDSGGCGQDSEDIIKYGQEVFDSDPQKNVIFDMHVYGKYGSGQWSQPLLPALDKLAATGLVIVIGEFGPGRNIGPSPTTLTPEEIMKASEERGFGWLAWAWDDPAFNANENWFAMSLTGDYKSSADLTAFGKVVVEHPTYGLLKLAKPATIFP